MMMHPEYRDESRVIQMRTYLLRIVAIMPELVRSNFIDGEALTERVLYNLTILGEAANNVSREYAASHPEVDFRDMAGLRHKLIHDYANIDLNIVWDIVQHDVPHWCEAVSDLAAVLPPPPEMPKNAANYQ